MSLRLRLLAGLTGLVLFGLGAFGTGTYVSLRHFLLSRLDQQLSDAAAAVARSTRGDGGRPGGPGPGGADPGSIRADVGPDLFVEILDSSGTVVATVVSASPKAGPPDLSSKAAALSSVRRIMPDPSPPAAIGANPRKGPPALGPIETLNAPNEKGGSERIALIAQPGGSGVIVVAGSFRPLAQTIHRLLLIELGVGAGVVTITLLLGLALAQQATQPLEEIAQTADAIAGGELERRVPDADPRSEVGRVGIAINSMLNEIQSAFARRDATETRLRRFVADASHELSTPLTSIRGYAELFRRGLADHPDDLATAMSRIESEGARMGGLVDDLLLLASYDNGRPLRRDPVDLAQVVADAGVDLVVTCPDRTVTVETSGPLIVLAEENSLRQVAANLASNARRHTPAGTPITLRTRVDGAFGLMEVADAGPGLTSDAATRVFDRFYRVDKARARSDGGAGLGLSIVATITEALDGKVSLETSPGHGAIFRVAIPLAEDGST